MASFWKSVFAEALIGKDKEMGRWVITASLRSAPYLIRQKSWFEASYLLEQAILRDTSSETIASVLPLLRHIAQATRRTDQELSASGLLASTLQKGGRWREAEEILRSLIPNCVAKSDFRAASWLAGELFNILRKTGRYKEALKQLEEMKAYIRQAGLGPWTQLLYEAQRATGLEPSGIIR
jgi:tetratricopeptide (TPR) repeat protein